MSEIIEVSTEMEVFEPKITRKMISIYEYAKILTDLSLHLYNTRDLNKYIDEIEVKNIIDTNKLAYRLLKDNVFDAVIDRGYEKVTFSKLKINPKFDILIENYLEEQEKNRNEGFLSIIGLLND